MKREILFRGKRIDNGEWVQGGVYEQRADDIKEYATFIIGGSLADVGCAYPVIPETVGQYVGLHDKNGKMIFTGHIVLSKNGTHCLITLRDFEYIMTVKKGYPYHRLQIEDEDELEIVGNIFDNPELLGEMK